MYVVDNVTTINTRHVVHYDVYIILSVCMQRPLSGQAIVVSVNRWALNRSDFTGTSYIANSINY